MEKELNRVPRLLSESYNSGLIERLYESGGSVMLDIIIYLCGNHVKDLFGELDYNFLDLKRIEKMKEDNVIEDKAPHISKNINEIRNTALLESLNETEQYLRLRIKK